MRSDPGLDGRMVVERPELRMLEGHEAVDDDGGSRFGSLHLLRVVQQTVPAEPRQLAVDGGGCDPQFTGDLAIGHAADGLHDELA
jgi:hypothetical protein